MTLAFPLLFDNTIYAQWYNADMITSAATDYLPVDLLGIGSTPLLLFVVAATIVVIGFVASSLMLFYFRTSILKGAAVLLIALLGAGAAASFAFGGYHETAANNLSSNISSKYPDLKLQSPDEVIDEYVLLTDSDSNAPLEVSVLHNEETLKYRLDLSKGKSEPVLSPADSSEAPNPIMFMRPGTVQ